MIRPEHLIEVIGRGAAVLRAGRHKAPVRVRMHPLDIALLRRPPYSARRTDDGKFWVLGCPIEPDCAVTRGRPEVEYE